MMRKLAGYADRISARPGETVAFKVSCDPDVAGYRADRVPSALRGLAVLGRWSLSYYMLHQPVLIGALLVWGWWRGPL